MFVEKYEIGMFLDQHRWWKFFEKMVVFICWENNLHLITFCDYGTIAIIFKATEIEIFKFEFNTTLWSNQIMIF